MPFDDTPAASEASAALEAEAGPGATAILHGMLSTLAEVLGELDRRLVSIEAAVRERADAAGGGIQAVVDGVHHRLDRLTAVVDGLGTAGRDGGEGPDIGADAPTDPDVVFHALDAVAARLESRLDRLEAQLPSPEIVAGPVLRLEAAVREIQQAVAEGMVDLAARQARLVDEVERALAADRARAPGDTALDRTALREELERLEVTLRGQAAEMTGQARSVADVVGALDGRLRDVAEGVRGVSQHAGALAALPKRLEALREELTGLTRGPGAPGAPGGMAHSA